MTLKVDYLSPEKISQIPAEQWDELSASSQFQNVFYERAVLVPAAKFLVDKEDVQIVTAYYEDSQLIALFPIKIQISAMGFTHVSVWKNNNCFLCDPLCNKPNLMDAIIKQIIQKFDATVFRIEEHSYLAYGKYMQQSSFSNSKYRGAVCDGTAIQQHFFWQHKKIRSEHQRIEQRLFKIPQTTYKTSETDPQINWLDEYCKLESAGWKRQLKGDIYSSENLTHYYQALQAANHPMTSISFQGIFLAQQALAISFRIISNGYAYDLKTSYNQEYRHLYPGVVLELKNLQALAGLNIKFLDSCTSPDNQVINRIWPDKRQLLDSTLYTHPPTAKLYRIIYRFKPLIKRLLRR